ncbi:hypothetical protein [methane-oxidizing endosymbiont of Gigantopelta aegis]|uniref:hypothetical protein n=1 Tax=methane-oxidizing endosymbiont of Gigantopelta aegis TaxID=2794938 RepID=UPI0018DBEDE7|nr:hypothetical protein [methane-oxidizing endosymbiont of Gigantopelta aegis]
MRFEDWLLCAKKWVNQWFGRSFFDQITRQNATRLSAYFERVKFKHKDHPLIPCIQKQLDELNHTGDWDKVKAIELLIVPLLDPDDLNLELQYRLHYAELYLPEYEYSFFKNQFERHAQPLESSQNSVDTESDALSHKQALLTKLLISLQKFYEDRQLRSIFANKARFKIGLLFGLSIILSVFLLAIGILHPDGIYQYCTNYCPEFTWLNSITADTPDLAETKSAKIQLHFAITALMTGYMGACFSMLISLKSRIETITLKELENLHKLHFIVTRIITGVGAALICYYFFRARVITGSVFPDFTKPEEIDLNSKSYFTLIIWSFIAGFSEKLVPSILSKTEGQLANNQ